MKKKAIFKILILVLALAMAAAAASCRPAETTPATTTAPTTTEAPKEVLPDVPANRFNARTTPRTGNNATMPLVVSTGTLDGKFSPFFATSAYDVNVASLTQIGLLHYDKYGAPSAGIDDPSLAYEYIMDISADNSISTYTFVLKNGIKFSDGTPVTAKDVLFSIYVYSDPMYDGASTFYAMNIQGMSEYRLQTKIGRAHV